MVRKKICLLGTSAVGKTSLVDRYVNNLFSDRYLTTVGVKISKKILSVDAMRIELLIWDLNGEDRFQKLSSSYLRGASGYFLVIDGTRHDTLESAHIIHERVRKDIGDIPVVLLFNKSDLSDDWEISDDDLAGLDEEGWTYFRTSAKSGTGVEDAFKHLAAELVPDEQN